MKSCITCCIINTAAGLRYVIYAFATALDDPSKVIAEPSGMLIGPRDCVILSLTGDDLLVNNSMLNVLAKTKSDSAAASSITQLLRQRMVLVLFR